MSNIVPLPYVQPLEVPKNIQGDRRLINEAASVIRNLWSEINAAAKYIAAGRQFKTVHDLLARNSRYDRNRIGWVRAFTEPEGKFGCDRRMAERCIRVFGAFGPHVGQIYPSCKLPQHFQALDLLATFDLPPKQLARYLENETISPNISAKAIRKLGEDWGVIKPKPIIKGFKEPVSTTGRLISSLNIDELLAACSPTQCKELWGRAKGQLVMIGVPEAKILALPAPATPLPLRHDLVAAWDAATPDEQSKLVRERENEILNTV